MHMNKREELRFQRTHKMLSRFVSTDEIILDLGTPNKLSSFLKGRNYKIESAFGFDFDLEPDKLNEYNYEVLTAFEVLEHLVSPFPLLKNTKATKLLATVPLKLWFAKAHRNIQDPYDQHFHEFESWQLDMLLEKAGWQILHREKWIAPTGFLGIRPLLRKVTPRFYAIYAERK